MAAQEQEQNQEDDAAGLHGGRALAALAVVAAAFVLVALAPAVAISSLLHAGWLTAAAGALSGLFVVLAIASALRVPAAAVLIAVTARRSETA